MKENKLLIFFVVLIIVGGIVFVIWSGKKDSYKDASNEVKDKVNDRLDYYVNITKYYSSKFDGVDLLFEKDKFNKNDVSNASLLRLATSYVNKELNNTISNNVINQLVNDEGLDKNVYTFYDGKLIRQAIKELFDIDYKDQGIVSENNFKYGYQYYKDYDVYVVSSNDNYVNNEDYQIDYKVLNIKENKDGDIKVEFVIAYVFIDNAHSSLKYSSKSDLSDLVYEVKIDDAGIKEEDKFTKFNIFLKKTDNGYVFDSLEKIK